MALDINESSGSAAKDRFRINWIDNIRGFALINMVLYHLLFDLVYIFGVNIDWYKGLPGYCYQQAICMTFIFISGISCSFGRSNIKRGAVIFAAGMLMTLGTWVAMPNQLIKFGILHFIGAIRIIFGLLQKPLSKLKAEIGFAVFFLLFIITKTLPEGYLGVWDAAIVKLPEVLYSSEFLFPIGLPSKSFWSGDYFPMIPWSFLFLAGYYFWGILAKYKKQGEKIKQWRVFGFLGKHSLLIYVLHQPVIYGILVLLNYFKLL